jgi:hypothetical protein
VLGAATPALPADAMAGTTVDFLEVGEDFFDSFVAHRPSLTNPSETRFSLEMNWGLNFSARSGDFYGHWSECRLGFVILTNKAL